MATIPIEVIIQDAESPVTPTPESGEETNITVPDTGTISDVNNSGGIGSSASIILPAIIAVLAIGAIVAMLVHKHRKHQNNNKLNKKEKIATITSGTIAILAAIVLVGNLVIPATKAATSVEPGTAELETEDKITIIATREQDSDTITATVKDISYATANLDFGYKVTASMAEGTTTANLYLDGNTDSPYYIAPTENGDLSTNSWGYMLEGGEYYQPMTLANTPVTVVKGNDNIVENKPVDIYYTIKVDNSLPTGTYTGELEYILTDNNFPSTLTTMQGMTTEICENTYTPGKQVTDPVPTATLEDIRDHSTYTIAKLADGKCWMTQNLDLDLISDPTAEGYVALTPANTNIKANWTPANSTIDITNGSFPGWVNNNNVPYSADPGDVYYYTTGDNTNEQAINKETCERDHEDGSCPHYHAGNYYNWSAAVAMNDTSEYGDDDQYVNVETSICPAGWRLPKNRNEESPVEGNEQITMITSYDGILGEYSPSGPPGGMYNYLEGGFNAIRSNPLWLARSGFVINGTLSSTGYGGYYWSSTVFSSSNAYQLDFGSGYVSPAYYGSRGYGYSVRCVAR